MVEGTTGSKGSRARISEVIGGVKVIPTRDALYFIAEEQDGGLGEGGRLLMSGR